MPSVYKCHTEGEVALAAAGTSLNVLGVSANANFGIVLKEVWLDFDGIDAANKPVRLSLSRCTFATNAPGTNSTAVTVKKSNGRQANTGFAAGKNWTVAPTVIETVPDEQWSLDPNKGIYRYAWPLCEEPDSDLGEGWLLQAYVETGDTVVAAIRAGLRFTRT